MKVQCPVCRAFVFERFGAIQVMSVMAELGIFGAAIAFLGISGYKILLLAVGLVALEYLIRLGYVLIHNFTNENIY